MRNFLSTTSPAPAVRHRATRGLRAFAFAGIASFTALGVTAGDAAASSGELAVNALAPDITATATRAAAAYDAYIDFGAQADYLTFAALRSDTARLAARQLGYAEPEMVAAWREAGMLHQRAVLAAMTQIGVPYRTNASAEGEGFDCSGLTKYAWDEAGVEITRISGDQINAAERVARDGAHAGDLVYFPGHVMMYLGVGDAVVHSVNTGRTVEIDTISQRRSGSVRFGDPVG